MVLDKILDKVHSQGIHKLTRREKQFLLRQSKKRDVPPPQL